MNKRLVEVLIIVCFASTLIVSQFTTMALADNWPMFEHDLAHTSYTTSSGPINNQTLWVFPTGGAIETSPAIMDGKVYFGSNDGSIYCVNASTGTMIWNYPTGGPAQSSPDVLNGVVYAGGFHSHAVFALNASSGVLLWRTSIASDYPNAISATAVARGLVFVDVANVGSGGGSFYALNATTGSLVWNYQPIGWYSASPAYADGLVYLPASTYKVDALYATSGQKAWTYYIVGSIGSNSSGGTAYYVDGSISVGDGIAYIGGIQAEMVQALNASTGAFIWAASTAGNANDVAVAGSIIFVTTTYGGTSLVMHTGGVSAFDAKTGRLLWNHTIGSMSSSPAVANGIVYATSNSNLPVLSPQTNAVHTFYALNATTGDTIWTYDTGNALFSSPAVANGVVYVGSNDGNVYAFGPETSQTSPGSSVEPSATATTTPVATPSTQPTTFQARSPTPSVPEFPSWMVLPLAMVTVLIVLVVSRNLYKQSLKQVEPVVT